MMAVGFGRLRLAPRDFWSLTFPELLAALDGLYGVVETSAPPARADLERLMQRYPDRSRSGLSGVAPPTGRGSLPPPAEGASPVGNPLRD